MAEVNQTQVDLLVNGQQAERELEKMRDRVNQLKKSLEDAYRTGTKESQQHFRKELKDATQQLRRMESGVQAVERTMRQLNRATPQELNKSLRFLQNELKSIERGTPAWDAHVQKIRLVKAEIDKVNAELRQSESMFTRMKNRLNDWGNMIAVGAGAVTGLVMAGKKAVNTYAEMQQEEANVRKYTGMTEEQVNHLNEAFKKMDTRSSREALNQLAQEAGRLGKQSEEDVLGFVRAADKINVALDELGDGATLTLSKLTTIFGDEERLGTERSLLAVGSVINELSQNSTAAAPYLAEFGQRLAGVGAQAHMTIPEIMGFGAVLDSQGQKLEMSATALSKVIMNLFKDPAKIASATGLAVEQFSETCKRSTNEGLLMLLDRLHELGGIDTLAPVFKDMGENGARASAVLAALAGNVDMVRQQQEAANVAFQEATSIDKEFEVQNTTVQASLEKARKGFTEMAVTLGKELMPVMRYFISGTSATMRLMLKVIQFLKEHRTEVLSVTAAVIAYYTVLKAQDAWNAFVGGTKKAIEALKAFTKALMANPWAAAAALIAGITVALVGYIKKSREAARAADEQRKAMERQAEAEKRVASSVGEVIGQYQRMKAEWEKLTTAQQKREWLEKNRDAFEQLGLNINNAVDADEAFLRSSDKVIEALKARAKAEALQDLYQQKVKDAYERAVEEGSQKISVDTSSAVNAQTRAAAGVTREEERWSSYSDQFGTHSTYEGLTEAGAAKVNEYYRKKAEEDVARLTKEYTDEVDNVYGQMFTTAQREAASAAAETGGLVGEGISGTVTGGNIGGGGGQVDVKERLKQIDEENKAVQARNQIAYLQGEKDFKTYTEDKLKQEAEYHKQRRDLYAVGSTEYLQEEAARLEAEKKLKQQADGRSVEEEQKRYSNEKAAADQRYADGKISARTYQLEIERLELEHLQNMVDIYDEGSEERLKAQEAYNKKSLQYQHKHAEEARKMQDSLRKQFFSSVSGVSDPEGYEEKKLQLAALREVMMAQATADQKLQIEEAYQKARYELAKEYHDEEGMYAIDVAQASVDEVLEYMKTDAFQGAYQAFSTLVSGMSKIFSSLTDLIDAETDLQTSAIERKYQAEIDAAGNNSQEVARLEEEKEKEIAKVKNEAEEKKYAMQIASTIAQTAIAAINAYSSAAAIPVVGWILGPVAAGMAVAAGALELAALKKQHDLAMSQGYAEGGYTMPGKKYQPAGIVHAGEWVASQELLANPVAAATIAQLDMAQKTNTIGSLSRPSVPAVESVPAAVQSAPGVSGGAAGSEAVNDTLQRLNKTLDGGIYAATLLTGDKGLLRAQRRHNQLLKNKGK